MSFDPETVSLDRVPMLPPWRLSRRLLGYARPYLPHLCVSLLLLLAMSLLVNRLPMVFGEAVQQWIVAPGLALEERLSGLTRSALVFMGLLVASFVVRSAETLLTAWVSQRIVYDLRAEVFQKALRLPAAYFDQTPVGRVMTRVTSDVEAVQRFVTEAVVGSIADLFMLGGVVGYMFAQNARLAGWLMLMLPALFFLLHGVNLRLRRANRAIRERTSAMNGLLQEQISGMSTIQLFSREPQAARRFDEKNHALRHAHFDEIRWFSLYWPVLELTQAISTLVVLGLGGWAIASGAMGLRVGDLVAFFEYVRNFYRPLGALTDKAGSFQQATASGERLLALLDTPEEILDPETPKLLPARGGAVEFDNVSFAYLPGHDVLHHVAFRVAPGETAAFVGATGAGKSTVMSLLARFYDVREGAIRVDGVDLRETSQRELRRRVGWISQEPFLFSGTIAENISLQDPDISRERVEEAARYVRADRFITRLPRGYDTMLGERGGALSTGEKQLLALARVMAHRPEVLVVFDEATAHVDSETEQLIQEATRNMTAGRTCLFIAHRLSTIRTADRIYVMRSGAITAQGTHAELMERDPYYRNLYELLGKPAA
ncbi:MAG: ABC transporter ATP-binding protein [Kiritimatiellae bacterium]|nr:ABC transporter ATP-binding protein [Kiritimatiellia bacterium]